MFKLLSQLLGAVAGAFALALFITLNIYLTPFLGAWMFLVDAVLLIGTLVFVSFMADISIPLVRTVLRRSYYRIKFKKGKARKLSNAQMFYLKVLASLIVLFKSTEDGFEVIKDEAHIIHGKAILFLDKEKKTGKEVFVQLEAIHRSKQRRAATVSAMAITLFVMGSVLTALFSSLMYPNIFQSQAATYTWTQTSWAGGASTTVAVHPGDQSGWTQYLSADSSIVIDGSGNITMGSGIQDVEETTTEDFNNGVYLDASDGVDDTAPLTSWPTTIINNEIKLPVLLDGTCNDLYGIKVLSMDLQALYNSRAGDGYHPQDPACIRIGLRCPTDEELVCICQHQDEYDNSDPFDHSLVYHSRTTVAWMNDTYVNFNTCGTGNVTLSNNDPMGHIRCVSY